jgi:hypothetical protein
VFDSKLKCYFDPETNEYFEIIDTKPTPTLGGGKE